ncbi:MAG: Ig-like domain-containing protein, partial [Gammaproteobacteria bacterium]|nr:Ig-like domain-containing protein [Gammaproteobacteria bacterium]
MNEATTVKFEYSYGLELMRTHGTGSKIGIVKDPFGPNPRLLGATTPIPMAFLDELAIDSTGTKLYANFERIGNIAVYDLDGLEKRAETNLHDYSWGRYPLDLGPDDAFWGEGEPPEGYWLIDGINVNQPAIDVARSSQALSLQPSFAKFDDLTDSSGDPYDAAVLFLDYESQDWQTLTIYNTSEDQIVFIDVTAGPNDFLVFHEGGIERELYVAERGTGLEVISGFALGPGEEKLLQFEARLPDGYLGDLTTEEVLLLDCLLDVKWTPNDGGAPVSRTVDFFYLVDAADAHRDDGILDLANTLEGKTRILRIENAGLVELAMSFSEEDRFSVDGTRAIEFDAQSPREDPFTGTLVLTDNGRELGSIDVRAVSTPKQRINLPLGELYNELLQLLLEYRDYQAGLPGRTRDPAGFTSHKYDILGGFSLVDLAPGVPIINRADWGVFKDSLLEAFGMPASPSDGIYDHFMNLDLIAEVSFMPNATLPDDNEIYFVSDPELLTAPGFGGTNRFDFAFTTFRDLLFDNYDPNTGWDGIANIPPPQIRQDISPASKRYILDQVINPDRAGALWDHGPLEVYVDGGIKAASDKADYPKVNTVSDLGRIFGETLAHEIGHEFGLYDEYDAADAGPARDAADRPIDGIPNFMCLADTIHVSPMQRDALYLAFDDPKYTISLATVGTVDRAIEWWYKVDKLGIYGYGPYTYDAKLPFFRATAAGEASIGALEIEATQAVGALLPEGESWLDGLLLNGDFSIKDPNAADFGWTVIGNVTVGNSPTALREDPRFLTGLSQSFVLGEDAQSLRFTILGANFADNGDGPPDAFEFALLGEDMQSLIGTVALSHADAAFNVQADGTVFTSPRVQLLGLDPDGRLDPDEIVTVEADLTGLAPGTVLNLFLDLIGFGPTGSEVWIDNVRIVSAGEEVNDPPVAADDAAALDEDGSVTIPVLVNDSDPEGDALGVFLVDDPAHGTLVLNADGTVTYTPAANYFGPDRFTYRVGDGELTSGLAEVSLTVNPVNDAPQLDAIADAVIAEETLLAFVAMGHDVDLPQDTLTFSLEGGAPAGAAIDPVSGAFSWTPSEAQGPGEFDIGVRVTDGGALFAARSFHVRVDEVNRAPVLSAIGDRGIVAGQLLSFTAAASDPDIPANALTFSLDAGAPEGAAIDSQSGLFTWTPAQAQAGIVYAVTVRVRDQALEDAETFAIHVAEANTAPAAGADAYDADEDTVLEVAATGLLANDTDADEGDVLTVTAVNTTGTLGLVTWSADGSFRYDPAGAFESLAAG